MDSKHGYMRGINGLELTPKKSDYLKFINEKKKAKTTEISDEFKVDPSTTTKILLELAKTDLITYTPYHGCSLTEKGVKYAEFLNRRHGLIVCMLAGMGMDAKTACEATQRFEYFVTKDVVDILCMNLFHPDQSPCGIQISHDTCCCCPAER
jgi:DtxR family Mn-dependent transcriptional regulator